MPLRRFFRVLLLTILLPLPLLAQTDDDDFDYNFDDIPVDEYRTFSYIGFGAGYLGLLSFINTEDIDAIAAGYDLDPFQSTMLLSGGGGFLGGIGIENIRFGVYAWTGSQKTEAVREVNGTNFDRSLTYSKGFIGLQVDYAILLPPEGLVLFPGVLVGSASEELEFLQRNSSGVDFNTVLDASAGGNLPPAGSNYYYSASRRPIHLQPSLNLEYSVTQFLTLRIGGGYGLNFAADRWSDPAGEEIAEMPEIQTEGANLQFGVFLGLFQR